jgi:hypothetical protein
MAETEQVLIRSYLDALSDYERVNKEAVAVARRRLLRSGSDQHSARDNGNPANSSDAEALRDVMTRWHNSLLQVLGSWEQVPHDYRTDG